MINYNTPTPLPDVTCAYATVQFRLVLRSFHFTAGLSSPVHRTPPRTTSADPPSIRLPVTTGAVLPVLRTVVPDVHFRVAQRRRHGFAIPSARYQFLLQLYPYSCLPTATA